MRRASKEILSRRHPPSSARALPAPLQLLRGAGALPGASGRSAVWGRPDGGLDTHPAPPRTRTHTHSYTHTRSTSATHTPAPAAFFTHPLAHLTLHTSLLTARRGARLADRVPGPPSVRRGLLHCVLCQHTPPHLSPCRQPPTPESLHSRGTPCPPPSPTPQHAHLEESCLCLSKSHLGEPSEVPRDSKQRR